MSAVVVLDSGPTGLLARRKGIPTVDECRQWQKDLLAQDIRVILPEIVDYEVRRELARINAIARIERLNRMAVTLEYLPITTEAMRLAATLWGQTRRNWMEMCFWRRRHFCWGQQIRLSPQPTSGI